MSYIVKVTGAAGKASHGTISFSEDPIIVYKWVHYRPFLGDNRSNDRDPLGYIHAVRVNRLSLRRRKDGREIRQAIISAVESESTF
jgi:hypothetical protein